MGPIEKIWSKKLPIKAIGAGDAVVRQVRGMSSPELTKPSIGFVPHRMGTVKE
ncbi:MAG: hypothetical protein HQL97_08105 [Magnetococcales bacterium]|nr:hypothetical protein [Magnetococcales bacterium]